MNAAWPSAAYALVGTAIACAHLHRSGLRGSRLWAYAAGFGPLVGITTASLLLFVARAVGARPPGLTHFIVAGTAIALTSVFTRPVAGGRTHPSRWHTRQPPLLVCAGIGVAGVAVWITVTACVAFTRTWPVGTWDAVAIWGARALLIHRAYDAFPALLQQGAVTLPHYPLLVPGAVAAQYFMLGGEHAIAPALVGVLAVFSVAVLVFVAVREEAGAIAALLALAFVLTSQPLWAFGFGHVADAHVAAGLLAAGLGMTSHLAGSRMWPVPPLLVGYCFSMLLWAKNEGLVLAAIVICVWALAAAISGASLRPAIGVAVGAAPGLLALLLFKRFWVPESGIDSFFLAGWQTKLLVLERWLLPMRGLAARLVPGGTNYGWGSTWLALLLGIVLIVWWERRRQTPARVAWALALALTAAFWVFTYATTPYDPVWHIASSLDRLMLQVWPLAVAGVFGAMGAEAAAWRERRAGRAS
jgi:hypothetical protein